MERWVTKLVALLVVLSTMTTAGLLPIKVADWYHRKGAKGQFYISILNCFGGGVFLGTAIMHIIPEVKLQLDEALLVPNNITYPLAELAIGAGFFLLLFVDKIATIISHRSAQKQDKVLTVEAKVENGMVLKSVLHGIKEGHENDQGPPSPRLITRTYHEESANLPSKGCTNKAFPFNEQMNEKAEVLEEDAELAARPYVFLIALSIDCIFEGMSLGLQDDNTGVWMLVIAILSHELVITFSFGLRLLKLFSLKKMAIIIIVYASTIPFGIAIGFGLYESGGQNNTIDIVGGFFLAMAAGIFIYITFLEILNEELSHDAYISKPIAVFAGFMFMAAMVLMDYIDSDNTIGLGSSSSSSSSQSFEMVNNTLCGNK